MFIKLNHKRFRLTWELRFSSPALWLFSKGPQPLNMENSHLPSFLLSQACTSSFSHLLTPPDFFFYFSSAGAKRKKSGIWFFISPVLGLREERVERDNKVFVNRLCCHQPFLFFGLGECLKLIHSLLNLVLERSYSGNTWLHLPQWAIAFPLAGR